VPQSAADRVLGNLNGTPHLSRMADYHPVDFADHLRVPILIIVADRDELVDNRLYGRKVFEIVEPTVPTRYEVGAGTHVFTEQALAESIRMALVWFDEHL